MGEAQSRVETRCLQRQGEGQRSQFLGGLPTDFPPAGADSTKRKNLEGLSGAVGSTCLPMWVTTHL